MREKAVRNPEPLVLIGERLSRDPDIKNARKPNEDNLEPSRLSRLICSLLFAISASNWRTTPPTMRGSITASFWPMRFASLNT